MNKLLAACLSLLCLILVFAGCTAATEEDAVRDAINGYYEAGNAGDFQKAATYIYTGDAAEDEKAAIPVGLEQMWALTGDLEVVSVSDITVEGSMATANVTLSWGGSDMTASNEFKFKKDDGNWKLFQE